jgi:type IV secretion system protein VirD4
MSKKRVFLIALLIVLLAGFVLFGLAFGIGYLRHVSDFSFREHVTLNDGAVWLLFVAAILGILVFWFFRYRVSKRVLKLSKGLEDAHWLTEREIRRDSGLTVTSLSGLQDVPDGVPLRAKATHGGMDIVLSKPTHTLVIGTTGSGKTTTFVQPVIEILSRTKSQPSMVITDPKGELYTQHAAALEAKGYRVWRIDLRDPFHSTRWNPFADVLKSTQELRGIEGSIRQEHGKYYFSGREFLTLDEAELEQRAYYLELSSKIQTDIQELVYAMCPVENKHDATWQSGARDLVYALTLAFWEDVRDKFMRPEQLTLANIEAAVKTYCNAECDELIAYFDSHHPLSRTHGLANRVLVTEGRTLTSYLTDVYGYLNWMADEGLKALTSDNEVDFLSFDEQPTVLFLLIPDHQKARHKAVTLFITQMYKALVDKAALNEKQKRTPDARLLRSTYFIMDEFGNMPAFSNMDGIVTVGRSRKIWLMPIIQDYAQLENKYGKDVAAILKSNTPTKVYIQASDEQTNKEFSEACGKTKHLSSSLSENKPDEVGVSVRAESVPLIYPFQLRELNNAAGGKSGDVVILGQGRPAMKSFYTPIYKARHLFKQEVKSEEPHTAFVFDEAATLYDIKDTTATRNALKRMEQEDGTEPALHLDEIELPEADPIIEGLSLADENAGHNIELVRLLSARLSGILSAEESAYILAVAADPFAVASALGRYLKNAAEKGNKFLLVALAHVRQQYIALAPPEVRLALGDKGTQGGHHE